MYYYSSSSAKRAIEIQNIFKPEYEEHFKIFQVKIPDKISSKKKTVTLTKDNYIQIMKMIKKNPLEFQNFIILCHQSGQEERIFGGEFSAHDFDLKILFQKEDIFNIQITKNEHTITLETSSFQKIFNLMNITTDYMLTYFDLIVVTEIEEIVERRARRGKTRKHENKMFYHLYIDSQNIEPVKKFRKSNLIDLNLFFENAISLYEKLQKEKEEKIKIENEKKLQKEKEKKLKEEKEKEEKLRIQKEKEKEEKLRIEKEKEKIRIEKEKERQLNLEKEKEKLLNEKKARQKLINDERERLIKENEELLKKNEKIKQEIEDHEKKEKEIEDYKDKLIKEKELYEKQVQESKDSYERNLQENEYQKQKIKEMKESLENQEKNYELKKRKLTEDYEIEIIEIEKRLKLKKEELEKDEKEIETKIEEINNEKEEMKKKGEKLSIKKQLEAQLLLLKNEKDEKEKLKNEINKMRKTSVDTLSVQKTDLQILKVKSPNKLLIEKSLYSIYPKKENNKKEIYNAPEAFNNEKYINKDITPEKLNNPSSKPKIKSKLKNKNLENKNFEEKLDENIQLKLDDLNLDDYVSEGYISEDNKSVISAKSGKSGKSKKIPKKKSLFPNEFDVDEKLRDSITRRRLSYTPDHVVLYPFLLELTDDMKEGDYYVCGNIDSLGNWDCNRALQLNRVVINDKIFYGCEVPIKQNQFPFEYKFFKKINDNSIDWYGKPYDNYRTSNDIFNYLANDKVKRFGVLNINIRYINDTDGQNKWDNRKQKIIDIIFQSDADIIFFQEMTQKQYEDISSYLDSIFTSVGIYRDKSIASEKISIAYNRNKFTLNHWGQFWLSSTPEIPGSNDFHNFFPRICTWVNLKKIGSEDNYLFFNVHLDHINMNAHLPSVKVLLNQIDKIMKKYNDNIIIFLGGCFYCDEDDKIIKMIIDFGFNIIDNENTYHDFMGYAFKRWDYMFYINPKDKISCRKVKVFSEESVIDQAKGIYASDHFPLYSEFQVN